MLDTGLLCAMSMDGIQSALMSGDIRVNEGAVAAALAQKGIPLYYYDKKTRMELDFVFKDNNRLSIIEVKSGSEFRRHAALDNASADYPKKFRRRIVLCNSNVEVADNGVIYLPLYMAMMI